MICRHDTHANSSSVFCLAHLTRSPLLPRRPPWFQCGIIPSFPPSPFLPPLQLAVNTDATNRGPRQLPESHLVLLYRSSHVWSAYRFPSLLFVYNLSHDPMFDNEFMPIPSSIPTPPKKLRGHLPPRLMCFCNPKSFLDPRRPVTRLPLFSRGLVLFVLLWSWVRQWSV